MDAVTTEDITFASNGGTAAGYIARPADQLPHPGVVVIQEWWGLNENIRDIARRFAGAGFVALAPDLYHGKVTKEPDEAQKAMMALDQAQVAKDLAGAVKALQSYDFVAPKRVGVTGFCMGGYITLVFAAAAGNDLGAAVSFYGGGYTPTEQGVAGIQSPLLAIYAGRDESTPEAERERLRQLLTDQGKTFDMVMYPDAEHAFFNDERPEVYNPAAAADAWKRTLSWFGTYLR